MSDYDLTAGQAVSTVASASTLSAIMANSGVVYMLNVLSAALSSIIVLVMWSLARKYYRKWTGDELPTTRDAPPAQREGP